MDETHGFSKDVCRSMVAMLDADKSGKLGFEEFETLLSEIAKWKAIFKVYDVENTGRVSGFQLREALNSAGYHLNNRVLNVLGHRYGSRDGKIAFDDFIMCAVKIKTYIGNVNVVLIYKSENSMVNFSCRYIQGARHREERNSHLYVGGVDRAHNIFVKDINLS